MKLTTQQINQKIRRQIFLIYFLRILQLPILISILFVICSLIAGKFYFNNLPIWFYCSIIIPVILFLTFIAHKSQKKVFTNPELWAYIDMKTDSSGKYLTANEVPTMMTNQDKFEWEALNAKLQNVKMPWDTLAAYLIFIALFLIAISFLPSSFVKIRQDSRDLLTKELAKLDILKNAGVLDNQQAEEIKKELDRIKGDMDKNGINKQNWEDKQLADQMLDKKLDEQRDLQEKLKNSIEQLKQKINDNEKAEEIAREMQSLESNLALNQYEKKSEEFKKAADNLKEAINTAMNNKSNNQSNLEQKLKALEAMKKFNKEMQKQQEERNNCPYGKAGQLNKESGKEKSLQDKLAELSEEIEKESEMLQAEILQVGDGDGKGGVSRGRGDADLKLNQNAEPLNQATNLEILNKGEFFNSQGRLVDISEGKHDNYVIDTQKNETRQFKDTQTDLINDKKVLPNRRNVIKKYFNRSVQEK